MTPEDPKKNIDLPAALAGLGVHSSLGPTVVSGIGSVKPTVRYTGRRLIALNERDVR